jgi:hypothetical protein
MTQIGTGTISTGGDEYFETVLTAGRSHRIYVHPEDPSVDFDLSVWDENGNLVDYDDNDSADAFCVVNPTSTGPFRLKVTAYSGASRYTLVVED